MFTNLEYRYRRIEIHAHMTLLMLVLFKFLVRINNCYDNIEELFVQNQNFFLAFPLKYSLLSFFPALFALRSSHLFLNTKTLNPFIHYFMIACLPYPSCRMKPTKDCWQALHYAS